jgi:hypothetical protein
MFAASLPISLGITSVVFSQATPGILISAACRRTCPFDDWEWFVAIKMVSLWLGMVSYYG